jgi:hypothetical protein
VRHGLLAGFLGAAGVVGLTASRGEAIPSLEYWLSRLSLLGAGPLEPGPVAAVAGGVLLAAIIGGWLGAQVFLPLAPAHMRTRRLKMGD